MTNIQRHTEHSSLSCYLLYFSFFMTGLTLRSHISHFTATSQKFENTFQLKAVIFKSIVLFSTILNILQDHKPMK